MQWAIELNTYDFKINFKIKYCSGKKYGDADAISRADHADEPAHDPRDDDDLVILGVLSQSDVEAVQ